jgi:dUTP pyrophosphatase
VGETKLVRTGIAFQIPEGYEIQVRSRSGLSLKSPLMVKNSPGTVDQDYLGECSVIMHLMSNNTGEIGLFIEKGDRIAQAVLCPVTLPDLVEVADFDVDTERGSGGFGSTGK